MLVRAHIALVLAVVAVATGACGDDDVDAPAGDDPVQRQVDVYDVVLRAVVTDADPALAEAGPPVVYVAARGDEPINVDVQADLVVELEEWTTIRFVDDVEEALRLDVEGAPVRDEGVLVGLGPVPPEGRAIDVYADRYEGPERTVVFEVALRRTASGWDVDEPLAGVPVATPLDEG